MSSLDSRWSEFTDSYQQSEVEQLLTTELGIEAQTVMMLAMGTVSNPPLSTYDAGAARASLMALKAANVDVLDIWFLVSKRPSLLLLREVLQRWLDFLTVYGLRDKGELHAGSLCKFELLNSMRAMRPMQKHPAGFLHALHLGACMPVHLDVTDSMSECRTGELLAPRAPRPAGALHFVPGGAGRHLPEAARHKKRVPC